MKYILLWLSIISFEASAFTVQCYRSKNPKKNIVYLHGIDTTSPSKQELNNRRLLQKLAQRHSFNLAISRSDLPCRTRKGSVCWPHYSSEQVKKTWEKIKSSTKGCIDPKKQTSYFGFSNGGYLLAKVFQLCHASENTWFYLVGSASSLRKMTKPCGYATIVIGHDDKITHPKAIAFYKHLKLLTPRVAFHEYQGGHELTPTLLDHLFNKNKEN